MTEPYKLTKLDISALRKADNIAVHLHDGHPEGRVRVIKRAPNATPKNPFPQEVEHVLPCPVVIDGYGCDSEAMDKIKGGRARCFELIYLYPSQQTHASCVIKTLREGDEITFRFFPDAHSNGYVAEKDLHADVLYLEVRRNGKRIAKWEIESSVCADNSARMCQGLTKQSYYDTQRQMREGTRA